MARMLTGMLCGLVMAVILFQGQNRNASADPQSSERAQTRIALVDMAKVFKNSRLFEKRREALKDELQDVADVAKGMQQAIVQMQKELERLDKSVEDRAGLEAKIKTKMAEFEKMRIEERNKFLKAESEIYLEVYEIATAEVATYARDHQIDLVIRFNAEPLEKDDPNKLLNGMNRQVVYENGLDITDDIIAAMK